MLPDPRLFLILVHLMRPDHTPMLDIAWGAKAQDGGFLFQTVEACDAVRKSDTFTLALEDYRMFAETQVFKGPVRVRTECGHLPAPTPKGDPA